MGAKGGGAMLLNLIAKLGLDASGWNLGMKRVESQSKAFATTIKSELTKAFGAAAVTAYGSKIINMADNLIDLSERLGVSTKALQEWAYAAKKSGSSIDAVTRFLERLAVAREMALGGDENSLAAFSKLGVSTKDLELLSLEQIARKISSTIQNGNIQDLIKSLRDVGGKGIGELVAAMKSFNELADKAPIIGEDDLEAMKRMKEEALGLADVLLGPVSDAIVFMGQRLQDTVSLMKILAGGIGSALGAASGTQIKSPKDIDFKRMQKDLAEEKRTGVASDYLKSIRQPGGGSPFDAAIDAFMDVFNKEMDERKARKDAIQKSIDDRRAMREAGDATPKKATTKEKKEIAEKSAREAMPHLTAWQQMGAAVRMGSDNYQKDIAKNTMQANEHLKDIKKGVNKPGVGGENPYK